MIVTYAAPNLRRHLVVYPLVGCQSLLGDTLYSSGTLPMGPPLMVNREVGNNWTSISIGDLSDIKKYNAADLLVNYVNIYPTLANKF